MSTLPIDKHVLESVRRTGAPFAATVIAAAFAGAILVEIPLLATGTVTWPAGYAWIASMVLGASAFSNPAAPWLGILMHLGVSAAWAAGYAATASRVEAFREHPVSSGPMYGIVVYVGMQLLLAAVGAFKTPTPSALLLALFDHTVFFGLPVALVTARLSRSERVW